MCIRDRLETIVSILLGLIAFAAFWENFLLKQTKIIERIALALASAGLLVPGLPWNAIGFILFISVVVSQKLGLSRIVYQKIEKRNPKNHSRKAQK
jgi:TRAP-type uncharacterized transport system fused permease subunit